MKTQVKQETSGCEVVYGHRIRGETGYFHIGSGSEKRAHNFKKRSVLWRKFVKAHGAVTQAEMKIIVEVDIKEHHHCPARARLREMEMIALLRPATNEVGRSSMPPGIKKGHPKGSSKPCRCGAKDCYGAEVARGQ